MLLSDVLNAVVVDAAGHRVGHVIDARFRLEGRAAIQHFYDNGTDTRIQPSNTYNMLFSNPRIVVTGDTAVMDVIWTGYLSDNKYTAPRLVEQGTEHTTFVKQDGRWMIEEAGDRDPSGARLGAMLQVMLARLPGERLPEIKCWWPKALVPPQVKIAASTPTQSVLMIRPLRDRILPLPPLAAAEVVYWHSDYI